MHDIVEVAKLTPEGHAQTSIKLVVKPVVPTMHPIRPSNEMIFWSTALCALA